MLIDSRYTKIGVTINPNYAIEILPDGFDTFKRKLIIAFEHSTIDTVYLSIIACNYYTYVSNA
jgi:hypothetical protein